MQLYTFLIVVIALSTPAHGTDVLAVLNIDSVGAKKVADAKAMDGVDWWIEVGPRLLVSGDESNVGRWNAVPILSLHAAVTPEELVLLDSLHCHDGDTDPLHKTVHDPFLQVPGATIGWHAGKATPLEHTVLHANQVVLAQLANLPAVPQAVDYSAVTDRISVERYSEALTALADFNRQESPEIFAAIEWLESQLSELPVEIRRDAYSQRPSRPPNLVAVHYGTTTPDDVIVIGAHLDSRNGPRTSTKASPGAEDNGSGSAGVLEAARAIAGTTTDSTIIFAWFTGEETGLLGSTAWVRQQQEKDVQIRAMLNMDMISYTSDQNRRSAVINSTFAFDLLGQLAASGVQHSDLDLSVRYTSCCTDHVPFLNAGIPAVATIQADGTSYPHYHRFTDTPDHLTPDLGVQITRMNVGLLAELAGVDLSGTPEFTVAGGTSGYWYDPEQSGHGFQVEVLEGAEAVVTWYTFDHEGQQMWLIGTGTVSGDQIDVEFVRPTGGFFPPDFMSSSVALDPWGTAVFRFQNCSEGAVQWQPLSESLTAGTMPLIRLTNPDGLVCNSETQ